MQQPLNIRTIFQVTNDNTDNKAKVIDLAPLHRVSKLLGVESAELLESLTSNSVVTRGETIIRNNSVEEAGLTRDSMAKALVCLLIKLIINFKLIFFSKNI